MSNKEIMDLMPSEGPPSHPPPGAVPKFCTRDEFEGDALDVISKFSHTPAVLQLGSRKINADVDSVSRMFPNATKVVGLDAIEGEGVDICHDIHTMSSCFPDMKWDVIWSDATLEHIEYPFLAVAEMAKILHTGGLAVHITHQTFPVHGFPKDFWRYSVESLESLFSQPWGFECLSSAYAFPQKLVEWDGRPAPWSNMPCFVHSMVLARKVGEPLDLFTELGKKLVGEEE